MAEEGLVFGREFDGIPNQVNPMDQMVAHNVVRWNAEDPMQCSTVIHETLGSRFAAHEAFSQQYPHGSTGNFALVSARGIDPFQLVGMLNALTWEPLSFIDGEWKVDADYGSKDIRLNSAGQLPT